MKRTLFTVWGLMALLFYSCSTNSKKTGPVKKEYLIGMTGLDSLKLGMSKAELESLLDTAFSLRHIGVDSGPYDTFSITYRDMDVLLYLYESNSETVATLFGLQSGDSSCRTAAGIAVGTEKSAVIDAYEGYKKYIAPEYEAYPVRSKTKSVIAVMDTVENRALLFHIVNRKVSSIEVSSFYEFY